MGRSLRGKRDSKSPCGTGMVFYHHYRKANILVVILYYNFIREYHHGKLGKAQTGSLYMISYMHMCEFILRQNLEISFLNSS